MVHEVAILIGRRQPTPSGVALAHRYPLMGLILIGAYVTMFLLAADGRTGWTVWDVATALLGIGVALRMAGGRWSGRGLAALRSGHVSGLREAPPPVIREPESWLDAPPEASPTAMTVAVVSESETWGTVDAVVSRLAQLAATDELLVVHGAEARTTLVQHPVVAGLRNQLPRHDVVTLHVGYDHGVLGRETAALLEQLLEVGSLPVVITPAVAVVDAAAEISSCLRADRVLRVSSTTSGIDLDQVWRRHVTASVG